MIEQPPAPQPSAPHEHRMLRFETIVDALRIRFGDDAGRVARTQVKLAAGLENIAIWMEIVERLDATGR